VIDGTDDGQACAKRGEHLHQIHDIEVVEEQVSRGRTAIDDKEVAGFRGGEDAVDLTAVLKVDEVRLG
jgi:hypothetical protein